MAENVDGHQRASAISVTDVRIRVLHAAQHGNAEELEACLMAGMAVDAVDEFGKSVMHYVARYGMLVSFHALMAVDPDQLHAKDKTGTRPLHCAAERAEGAAVLQACLEQPMNVNVSNNEGLTPLHVASFCGNAAAIPILVGAGAGLEVRTERRKTPLHLAAQNGNTTAVKALLDKDADVTAVAKDKFTALHFACASKSANTVETLLVGGADEKAATAAGETPLFFAAGHGSLQIVETLLHHNASPHDVDQNGRNSMHSAALHGHTAVVAPLVHGGGMLDGEDHYGNTPLHYAAMNNQLEMVSLLLHMSANVGSRNLCGAPPLHMAAKKGHVKVLEQLCLSRADLHAVDKEGDTACHKAAKHGHRGVLRYLLNSGAPLNKQNEAGDTCLHLAARHDNLSCLQELLHCNSNMTITNANGDQPISVAGPLTRPFLEDLMQEYALTALSNIGLAEYKDTPVVVFGDCEAGKSALIDSLQRHKQNAGILSSSETIYSNKHGVTLGIRSRHIKIGNKMKRPLRVLEIGGHQEFSALRAMCLRLPRSIQVIVLDLRQSYEELSARTVAWLELSKACQMRTSQGRSLRLRIPLLMVFSNADSSTVRVIKSARNHLNSTNTAERLYTDLNPLYKEVFDFGQVPYVMDCRSPFSAEMDAFVDRLFYSRKALLKESKDVPRVVEKVEALLPKIQKQLKRPWVPWEVFHAEACKKFFHGEDRDRIEAKTFMRRVCKVLHDDLKIISFSDGPAKDYVVLDMPWMFERLLPQLMANVKRPVGDMPPLTADEEGHVYIDEFEKIMKPFIGFGRLDALVQILASMRVLHALPDAELRILMPSWVPPTRRAPPSALPERSVFAGRRLKLGGVTARGMASLLNSLMLGLLEAFPTYSHCIWPLGVRLSKEVNSAMVEVTVELGEQRSNATLLVYGVSNLLPKVGDEPLKNLVTDFLEVLQLRLQVEAPSISMEVASLTENQLPQERRGSMDQSSATARANRQALALSRAQRESGGYLGTSPRSPGLVVRASPAAERGSPALRASPMLGRGEERLSQHMDAAGSTPVPAPRQRQGYAEPSEFVMQDYPTSPGAQPQPQVFVYGVDEVDEETTMEI